MGAKCPRANYSPKLVFKMRSAAVASTALVFEEYLFNGFGDGCFFNVGSFRNIRAMYKIFEHTCVIAQAFNQNFAGVFFDVDTNPVPS